MSNNFFPDFRVKDINSIDYEALKKYGYRLLLFDIDNTLVEHGAPANKEIIQFFHNLHTLGFSIVLLSNNGKERVEPFAKAIKADYFIYKARKPISQSYNRAMRKLDKEASETVFIGDQLFTDAWGAKRLGILTFIVEPINEREELQIVLKRKIERLFYCFYKQKNDKPFIKNR